MSSDPIHLAAYQAVAYHSNLGKLAGRVDTARVAGISEHEARLALEHLHSVGQVVRVDNGRGRGSGYRVATSHLDLPDIRGRADAWWHWRNGLRVTPDQISLVLDTLLPVEDRSELSNALERQLPDSLRAEMVEPHWKDFVCYWAWDVWSHLLTRPEFQCLRAHEPRTPMYRRVLDALQHEWPDEGWSERASAHLEWTYTATNAPGVEFVADIPLVATLFARPTRAAMPQIPVPVAIDAIDSLELRKDGSAYLRALARRLRSKLERELQDRR